jgi:hypothetical protein
VNEKAATSRRHSCASNSGGKYPLEKARVQYDIQGNVQTLEFHVTPSMSARMPIPGGYANAGWLLTSYPQPGFDNRSVVMTKCEGNRSELLCFGPSFVRFLLMSISSPIFCDGLGNPPLTSDTSGDP